MPRTSRPSPRTPALLLALALALAGPRAHADLDAGVYDDRFRQLWLALHDPRNGYFSPEGVPYHSRETFIVEAPDHGHETTSEAFSYWLWLEAAQGRLTGDWSGLATAWSTLERYAIPSAADQPTNGFYQAQRPATYAPEGDEPSTYPQRLDSSVQPGQDPLAAELSAAYGTADLYGMHWILDVDDWYGFGNRADGTSRPSFINTFQRGPQESVSETVPQPCWDAFRYGGRNGYLDLFVGDASYARQWKYSAAPDADARAVQALYWALTWAQAQGQPATAVPAAQAARLGDTLRYALFDKYFKTSGCQSTSCPGGTGRGGAHQLLSWYYAWGGSLDTSGGWAWRIGSSHVHFGYQNPLAAYALSQVPALKPRSSQGAADWAASLTRQLELYQWLQSAEGAIAGGATNSFKGRYLPFPTGTPTFHGLAYQEAPVYLDPPSNQWFGWQAWSMQRVAEYYLVTGDAVAGALLDRWVAWVKQVVTLGADGSYLVPNTLGWSGQPATWTGSHQRNDALHVTVVASSPDVGVAASLARALLAYAAARAAHAGGVDAAARDLGQALVDRIWARARDAQGVSVEEPRDDYRRLFEQVVYIPPGWSGTMPNGDVLQPGVTFFGLRSKYRQDPDFARVQAAAQAGQAPVMRYHRFWAQVEFALANADLARLFPPAGAAANLAPRVHLTSPTPGAAFAPGASIPVVAQASDADGTVARVVFSVDGAQLGQSAAPPYQVTWTGAAEGRHTVVATATDDRGASWSDQLLVVVGDAGVGGGGGGAGGGGGTGAGGGAPAGSGGGGGRTGSGGPDGGTAEGGLAAGGACGCGAAGWPGGASVLALAWVARRRRASRDGATGAARGG